MSFKDSLIGLLIIAIWGFNFVVIAWGVEEMPPLLMGAARFLCIALIGSLFIRKPNIPWRWLAAYAIVLCFGQFAFLFCALAFGMPAGLASLVLQSQALFTIIFSALLLKEVIKMPQILAMVFSGAGLTVIGLSQQETAMTALGFAFTLAAAISWGAGNIVNRMINQKGYRADIGLVVWSSWVAFIPFLISSFIFEGPQEILNAVCDFSLSSLAVILYLAFAASITGYGLWSYLLAHYPAGQVAPLTLGVPVVGMLSAQIFLGETISHQQVLGIILVMAGLAINALGGRLIKRVKVRVAANKD